jgi:hypothetical protein
MDSRPARRARHQPLNVGRMQSGCRSIENIQRVPPLVALQFRRELDSCASPPDNSVADLAAGYKNLHYLLLKAQRMGVTRTEFMAFAKAA